MSWWPPDVSTGRGSPQVNKFKKVSSEDRQMSLVGGQSLERIPCLISTGRGRGPMSNVQEEGPGPGGPMSDVQGGSRLEAGDWGDLYSEVQCIMGSGHMGNPCGQIDTTENITLRVSGSVAKQFKLCSTSLLGKQIARLETCKVDNQLLTGQQGRA